LLKIRLKKDLKRQIKKGHPWIFKDTLFPVEEKKTQLAKIYSNKNEFLCWGFYDPYSAISVRVLGFESTPPNNKFVESKIKQAFSLRKYFHPHTNCFRLLNGEGDLLPGLVCDIYDKTAVIQYDGRGPEEFWKTFPLDQFFKNYGFKLFEKPRGKVFEKSKIQIVKENNILFKVDLSKGQKTGFFLDQRNNRFHVSQFTKEKEVANLFSYTGGFSIYAGIGGAKSVVSVDISKNAIKMCGENWALNKLEIDRHRGVVQDVFEFLNQYENKFDVVIVDPPSMARSKNQKEMAIKKYIKLFTESSKLVKSRGHLFVSSCSSHIPFADFLDIATQSMTNSRKRAQILSVSGQGSDHPYPHICPELRYLKFAHLVLT